MDVRHEGGEAWKKRYEMFTSLVARGSTGFMDHELLPAEIAALSDVHAGTGTVLDLGSGQGRAFEQFRALWPTAHIVAVERDPVMASRCRAVAASHSIEVVEADFLQAMLEYGPAEAILCLGNTYGSLVKDSMRRTFWLNVIRSLKRHGTLVVDARTAWQEEALSTVLSSTVVQGGVVIETLEDVNGTTLRVPQFYPDHEHVEAMATRRGLNLERTFGVADSHRPRIGWVFRTL